MFLKRQIDEQMGVLLTRWGKFFYNLYLHQIIMMYTLSILQFYITYTSVKLFFFFKGECSEVVSVPHDTMVGESTVQQRAEEE